jgi:hypothetical protein
MVPSSVGKATWRFGRKSVWQGRLRGRGCCEAGLGAMPFAVQAGAWTLCFVQSGVGGSLATVSRNASETAHQLCSSPLSAVPVLIVLLTYCFGLGAVRFSEGPGEIQLGFVRACAPQNNAASELFSQTHRQQVGQEQVR